MLVEVGVMRIGVTTRRFLLAAAIALSVAGQPTMAVDTMMDLTTSGAIQTYNGGIFEQIEAFATSTGTGVIQPFLRVQSNDGIERGYNTGGTLGLRRNSPVDDRPAAGRRSRGQTRGSQVSAVHARYQSEREPERPIPLAR